MALYRWLQPGDIAMVDRIMGRCHVGKTDRQAIKHFMPSLKHGLKTFRSHSREVRRELLIAILAAHKYNQREYKEVMRGV